MTSGHQTWVTFTEGQPFDPLMLALQGRVPRGSLGLGTVVTGLSLDGSLKDVLEYRHLCRKVPYLQIFVSANRSRSGGFSPLQPRVGHR